MTDGYCSLIFSPWPAARTSCSQSSVDPKSLKAMFPTKSPELFSIYHTNTQNAAAKSSLRDILAMNSRYPHNFFSHIIIKLFLSLAYFMPLYLYLTLFFRVSFLYQSCLEILGAQKYVSLIRKPQ